MLTGSMTGILGRIIAVTFIVVGLVAGVMRQSIMGFVVGIAFHKHGDEVLSARPAVAPSIPPEKDLLRCR